MVEKNKEGLQRGNRGIQGRIIFSFIFLIILTGVTVAIISYFISVKTTTDEMINNVENQTASLNNSFELFFEHIDGTLERLASNKLLMDFNEKDRDELFQLLKETGDTNDSILNVYRGTEDTADMIIYPDTDLGDDFNPKERPWYIDAKDKDGEAIWTDPYVDAATGGIVVSAAKAYYENGRLLGVVSLDVTIETLVEMVNAINIGESGYFVLYDGQGQYVAHPDEQLVGEDESEKQYFQEMLVLGDRGIVQTDAEGKEQTISFTKNPTTGWIIAGIMYEDDFKSKSDRK